MKKGLVTKNEKNEKKKRTKKETETYEFFYKNGEYIGY